MTPHEAEIVKRFRTALDREYGGRLERVVLFGSRARGDAREDSDFDIAVFIQDAGSFDFETTRLADIGTGILFETGAVINAKPFAAGAYQQRTGFMKEVRLEGVDI